MIWPELVRSTSFRRALVLAAALTAIIVALFGFVYWKTDSYLTARSDQMIMTQLNVISLLSDQRLLDAIDAHLREDSRGVQFAGLFGADGSRIAGNIAKLPPGLKTGTPAHRVQIMAIRAASLENQVVQGVARQLPDGEVLVIGRLVDETVDVARVIGQALGLGLVFALGLCLVAGTLASLRAAKRVEEVSTRVQRIVAGDLHERLPQSDNGDPFSKLAAIVNGMLDEMETMIDALAGVGNDIAHDLRTPLTRARLTLERGRANAVTLEQLQATADKTITGIDQSLAIVTALLRLAEIENSRRSAGFGVVALDQLLREVRDIYEPIAETKEIALKVKASPELSVHGDRDLLIEAVANLVDNAIKFTPVGGRVDIDLIRGEGESVMRVSDTGRGISEGERDAVLRRFYRSEKDRNTPGVGLGLNLVAAIVKLHGFRLAIFPGPGCRVEIACPDQVP
ncbi:ATP-binding protein [Bradyrhizobium sp. Ash2021]|uniref:HAMP domain-containing sensor histidine kinase n=1 Tax=Bradyrhizobium sp. Ash2021 TaxID=2954771 RepID=UPI002815E8C8|nr:ATP-binding protein [Bradyrhizobium sp. Ash2021]WMT77069.1 ATP-binding protein [Bradyrhizobium sp. Ash2021]